MRKNAVATLLLLSIQYCVYLQLLIYKIALLLLPNRFSKVQPHRTCTVLS